MTVIGKFNKLPIVLMFIPKDYIEKTATFFIQPVITLTICD